VKPACVAATVKYSAGIWLPGPRACRSAAASCKRRLHAARRCARAAADCGASVRDRTHFARPRAPDEDAGTSVAEWLCSYAIATGPPIRSVNGPTRQSRTAGLAPVDLAVSFDVNFSGAFSKTLPASMPVRMRTAPCPIDYLSSRAPRPAGTHTCMRACSREQCALAQPATRATYRQASLACTGKPKQQRAIVGPRERAKEAHQSGEGAAKQPLG